MTRSTQPTVPDAPALPVKQIDACDYCDMVDEDFEEGDVPQILTYSDGHGGETRCHAECYAEMVAYGGHGDQDEAERARLAAIVGVS